MFDPAVWPSHFDAVRLRRRSQAKVQCKRVLGVITAAAHHLLDPLTSRGDHSDASPDGAAVGLRTRQFQIQPAAARAGVFEALKYFEKIFRKLWTCRFIVLISKTNGEKVSKSGIIQYR